MRKFIGCPEKISTAALQMHSAAVDKANFDDGRMTVQQKKIPWTTAYCSGLGLHIRDLGPTVPTQAD
jgi:hypothetical protein